MPSPDPGRQLLAADPLPPRVVAIGERQTGLLAMQLTAAVDELRERCADACADPVFARAWERFCSLPGSGLRQALEDPALEAWVGHLQALLRSPVLRTCPHQHVPRALARFTALALGFAGH